MIFRFSFRFKVVSVLEMPPKEAVAKEKGCPSKIFPSDHLRVEAVFELLKS